MVNSKKKISMPYFQNTLKENKIPSNKLSEIIRLEKFLEFCNLSNSQLISIPGDCSRRNYFRVLHNSQTYIIMDLLYEPNVLEPFIEISKFLVNEGLSAPIIYNISDDRSLVLLEDFGKGSYTSILNANNEMEEELYHLAIESLKVLYKSQTDLNLKYHNKEILSAELEVFKEWYLKPKFLQKDVEKISDEFFAILKKLYAHLDTHKPIISLKDFHADNLFYLPDRNGVKKVGIIDFQDALFSTPAHDLVSLLEDARRDVNEESVNKSLDNFSSLFNNKTDKDNFKEMYAINSIQRNLRIVGLFNRLNLRDQKPHYSQLFLPRVLKYVKNTLELPSLMELKKWFIKYDVL